MKASMFRCVAQGIVAMNKELGSKEVEITAIEWRPMLDGELASNPTSVEFTSKDKSGNVSQGQMLTDLTITATWLPDGSNRMTAPDVRRGERVQIYATQGEDKYYWKPMGLDDNLRKKETIVIAISNTSDESDTELKPENTYWIEFSTHSKKLAFSSSKSDGEAFLYECYFDMAGGEFNLTDDAGNFIYLNSAEKTIHLQNTDGTFVKVDKKDISIYAPRDILGKAERDVTVLAGRDMMLKAGVKATIDGGGSFLELTAGKAVLKAPTFQGMT